jgi:queuosine precursor transporter
VIRRNACLALAASFMACVVAANWTITHLGTEVSNGIYSIPVGFGLHSPSGVIFVGLSLTVRDALQRRCGIRPTIAAIVLGATLTLLIAPSLAIGSGTAFLVGEFSDFAVYTPLRKRTIVGAVIMSNSVGALVDSAVFLMIAFGPAAVAEFALPQVIGKLEWSALAFPLLVRPRGLR